MDAACLMLQCSSTGKALSFTIRGTSKLHFTIIILEVRGWGWGWWGDHRYIWFFLRTNHSGVQFSAKLIEHLLPKVAIIDFFIVVFI